jgi:hypothetical protein
MSKEELPTITDALNEYFRLKEKFENEMDGNKRKIINNKTLSKREKRSKYLKLMPKCVNCKRPSRKGTIFSITYVPSNEKTDTHRTFKAHCGDLANPCNLNIQINIGSLELLDDAIKNIRNEITIQKNKIINDKNKLLFGLISTERALEDFDNNKSFITDLTSVYEEYLDKWNKEIDNPEKIRELDEALVQSYESINTIKECIKKMNETNDVKFANDAATIYTTILQPLLDKIRQLKYQQNMVFNDNSYCKLIQRKYTIDTMLISGYESAVIAYDVGLKAKTTPKKTGFVIESESPPEQEMPQKKELSIKILQEEPPSDENVNPQI